jgi:hypothetical protein
MRCPIHPEGITSQRLFIPLYIDMKDYDSMRACTGLANAAIFNPDLHIDSLGDVRLQNRSRALDLQGAPGCDGLAGFANDGEFLFVCVDAGEQLAIGGCGYPVRFAETVRGKARVIAA